ncbi:MAG: phage terminase small subunit P27 family, partial [Gammaproteobacteria bacterium]|nr:phage terminase small subunit P27 family [Gammaproteobacteria bacterium]
MTAGRKPVPTALKLIKGTDQPCRINDKEPKPKSDNIKMPVGMSADAKKHWKQVSKQLKEAGILTNLDI